MIVDYAVYERGRRRTDDLSLEDALGARNDPDAFVWVGLHEPTSSEFDTVAKELALHELAVEDALEAHQRPKLEVYEDSLFLVLRPARYVDEDEAIEFGELQLIVGERFVVSVRHGEASPLADVRRGAEARPDLLAAGPVAVVHAVLDAVVDEYLPVLAGIDQDVAEVEDEVFSAGTGNPAERIYKLQRQVLSFYRATAPLVEPLAGLSAERVPVLDDGLGEYFRDVHDHLVHVRDQVATLRDLLTSVLDANLAQVGVRQNEDMRKISAWVAIAAVPTLLAGIWGMNFDHMPELDWTFGYPLALALMAGISLFLYAKFKSSGWL